MRTEKNFTSRASPQLDHLSFVQLQPRSTSPLQYMAGIASCLSSDPSALLASAASPCAAFTSITPGDGLLLASSAVRQPADAARSSAVVRHARHFLSAEFSTAAVQIIFFSSGGSGVSSGRYVDLASPLNGSNVVLKPLAPHAQLQIQIQVQSCVRV